MASWVTKEQIEEMKAMNASMKKSGPAQRTGRGRSSAPSPASTRGRGPTPAGLPVASTRPAPSPILSYNAYDSPIAARTAHAPGAVKSGVVNTHWTGKYSVGPSTAAPAFKPAPRQRAVSPVRTPAVVPAEKQKSPPKMRNSILVEGYAQPMVPPPVDTMAGGQVQGQSSFGQANSQSGWVNVPEQSSAYAANASANGGWNTTTPQVTQVPQHDPRFMAVQSPYSTAQQPDSFSSGPIQGQAGQVQQNQGTSSFGGGPGQVPVPPAGRLAGPAVPNAGPEPTTNNWTPNDPKKPIIPGHLRQNAQIAIKEMAASMNKRK